MDELLFILLLQVGILPIMLVSLGAYIHEHPAGPCGPSGWFLLIVTALAFYINLSCSASHYSYIKNSKELINRIPQEIIIKYLEPAKNAPEPTPTSTPTNNQKIKNYLYKPA